MTILLKYVAIIPPNTYICRKQRTKKYMKKGIVYYWLCTKCYKRCIIYTHKANPRSDK